MTRHRKRGGYPPFWTARSLTLRAVRSWRRLLPDWTPTMEQLVELDTKPRPHREVVDVIAHGWEPDDARWDCLLALITWERRDAVAHEMAQRLLRTEAWQEMVRIGQEMENEDVAERDLPVSEDHAPGDEVAPVPGVREEGPQAADVLPDPEPVQPGPSERTAEVHRPDPDGASGGSETVVARARLLHELQQRRVQ